MAIKSSFKFINIKCKNYTVELANGNEFQRPDGEKVPYDFSITISGHENSIQVNTEEEGKRIYGIINNLEFTIMIFFSNSRKLPQKPDFDIDKTEYYSPGFNLFGKVYKSSKFFQNYIDILRNESPLYIKLSGESNKEKSGWTNFFYSPDKKPPFKRESEGTFLISTQRERVGEGEEKEKT